MYETFYGFVGHGFRLTPDYRHRFSHHSYAAAAETLLTAIRQGKGLVILTGDPGTGKTTLVYDLVARLEDDGRFVGTVANSRVGGDDLLKLVGFAFGLRADTFSRAGLLTKLKEQLSSKSTPGNPAVLMIDDAQDLAATALQELLMLCNFTTGHGPLVQIVLAGQEPLWERLRRPEHAQIQRLVVASCRLNPLSLSETRTYIANALTHLGWRGEPEISAEALRLVQQRTGGVPRLINLTVSRLLLHGSLVEAHALGAQDVESVLALLGKDHPELLLDTSDQLLPSEPVSSEPLLPLDARAATEQRKPLFRGRWSLPALSRHRDAATQTLKAWLQRVLDWDRKWTLAVLSAAAVAAYIIFFVSFDGERPVVSAAREPLGEEESGAPARVRLGLHALERVETPLEQTISPAPLAAGAGIVATPGEQDGAVGPDEPDPVEVESAMVSTDPKAEELPDSHMNIPVEIAEIPPDLDQEAPLEGTQAQGQDQHVRVYYELSEHEVSDLLAKAEQALSKNLLTVPAGDNAYAYYRAALARDPGNTEARAGMGRILHRYRQLARQRLNRGDLRGARRFASRGLKIWPRDRQLLSIKRRAARGRARKHERTAPEILNRFDKWFRSGNSSGSAFLDE